ncbi:MAG: hypothetical protein ABUS47_12925 [Steroidobacter sp.]
MADILITVALQKANQFAICARGFMSQFKVSSCTLGIARIENSVAATPLLIVGITAGVHNFKLEPVQTLREAIAFAGAVDIICQVPQF